MEKLFGIPVDQLANILLAIFGAGVIIMGLVALRNRVMFRVGTRNIPRRPSQTALIVLGLMLATVLFSAAFTAGDTLTHSIRMLVLKDLGKVDVAVRAENHEADGRHAYFDQGIFRNTAAAIHLAERLGLADYCDIHAEQDSRLVYGLQLADLVAHTCATMLLETLGLVT